MNPMIPQEKTAAVSQALLHAFGVTAPNEISRITRGLSSDLVFRILVQRTPYLLRILTRMDERKDPTRVFACMNAAAQAGLAPRVLYSNPADGIAIIDWIETVPYPPAQALLQLPATLQRLHALPLFPKTFNYVTAHNYFIWRLPSAGRPAPEIEEVFHAYRQIVASYPRLPADMVSCHMDLKPENILFDGHRPWLIDWQAAFVNDRYFDLAIPANFLITNPAHEQTYLEQYFTQPPGDYERARFFLMHQILHMLAATVFLLLGSAGQPLDLSAVLPSFRDFHHRVWAGQIDLAENSHKVVYGRVHWKQLLENLRQPRFTDSLRILAEHHPRSVDLLLPSPPQ